MYKVKNNLSLISVQKLFKQRANLDDFRNKRCWEVPRVQTVNLGIDYIEESKRET